MAEAERTTKILEQAMLALRNLDLTGREGPLLADSTLLSGCIGSVSAGRERQKTADCVEKVDPAKWAMH